jgi:hypothetical protein
MRATMLVLVGWLVLGSGSARADEGPKPLPHDVVKAWEKAGAEVGWLGPDLELSTYLRFTAKLENLDAARAVPAFKVKVWREGLLAKLPAPGKPFGLRLGGTEVTDAGLKELAGLKKLSSLSLGATGVTDAGLKDLAGSKNLSSLSLHSTKVTDAGLKALAGLKDLSYLNLGGTHVMDEGLKHLAGLKNLSSLSLGDTKVTDTGLKELTDLKKLSYLDLGGTKVTEKGVGELQKALPRCKISR